MTCIEASLTVARGIKRRGRRWLGRLGGEGGGLGGEGGGLEGE